MHALQTKKWFQTLQKKIQLSFKKIRICKPKEDETSKLFKLRGNLRQKLKLSDEEDKDAIIEEIQRFKRLKISSPSSLLKKIRTKLLKALKH